MTGRRTVAGVGALQGANYFRAEIIANKCKLRNEIVGYRLFPASPDTTLVSGVLGRSP